MFLGNSRNELWLTTGDGTKLITTCLIQEIPKSNPISFYSFHLENQTIVSSPWKEKVGDFDPLPIILQKEIHWRVIGSAVRICKAINKQELADDIYKIVDKCFTSNEHQDPKVSSTYCFGLYVELSTGGIQCDCCKGEWSLVAIWLYCPIHYQRLAHTTSPPSRLHSDKNLTDKIILTKI